MVITKPIFNSFLTQNQSIFIQFHQKLTTIYHFQSNFMQISSQKTQYSLLTTLPLKQTKNSLIKYATLFFEVFYNVGRAV